METLDHRIVTSALTVAIAHAIHEIDHTLPEGAVPLAQRLEALIDYHIADMCRNRLMLTPLRERMVREAAEAFRRHLNNPGLKSVRP